jgi:pyridoxine 5-phosphate synthase
MKKINLGVNIDHVATIRNARGEKYPEPYKAAHLAQKSGADSITIHLREDRRHIIDNDLKDIKKKIKIPINLEMAATNEMLKIALNYKPDYVCIVPEKRKEITTEGGLNLRKKKTYLKKIINLIKKKNIRVSLFIDANISDIILAKKLGANCVELHTGTFCNLFNNKKNTKLILKKIKKAAFLAKKIGLEVHAGHGLTYNSVKPICKIEEISELNIGHSIISESIFIGLDKSIKKFKQLIKR